MGRSGPPSNTNTRLTASFPRQPGYKPAPERLNQSGFWWSKRRRRRGGSDISWSISSRCRKITTYSHHLITEFFTDPIDAVPDTQPTASKHWRQYSKQPYMKYGSFCSDRVRCTQRLHFLLFLYSLLRFCHLYLYAVFCCLLYVHFLAMSLSQQSLDKNSRLCPLIEHICICKFVEYFSWWEFLANLPVVVAVVVVLGVVGGVVLSPSEFPLGTEHIQ